MKYKVLVLSVFLSMCVVSSNVSAEVDFTSGKVIGQAANGSYSVLQEGGSTWNGIEENQLTAQQIKGFQMEQARRQAESIANYGVKGNPNLVSQVTTDTRKTTINVSAGSLKPNTQVYTSAGIVPASSLPPTTQVAVPYNSVFTKTVRGDANHKDKNSHSEHGTGNGGNNAANSHSAHGLGGGDHIGGGHSGGSFHY